MLDKLRKNWVRVVSGLLVLAVYLVHATHLYRFELIDKLEQIAYDRHLQLTMPKTVDPSVVIVDIDEISLEAEGRWPWPRDKVARLVEQLFDTYNVKLVGFDIVFAEPDNSSGLDVLQRLAGKELKGNEEFGQALEQIKPQLDYDRIFAEAISQYPVVLGYYFDFSGNRFQAPRIGKLPEPAFEAATFKTRKVSFLKADGFGGNIDGLTDNSAGGGHFTQQPDNDGVVRRVPMLIQYEDKLYARDKEPAP